MSVRREVRFAIVLAALSVVAMPTLSVAADDGSGDHKPVVVPTSVPPDTTVPPETTTPFESAPTETSLPSETSAPPETEAPATSVPPSTSIAPETSVPAESSVPPETTAPLETSVPSTVADSVEPPVPVESPDTATQRPPGLRASTFDAVYARGVPIGVAMATTRWLESRNDYAAQAPGSSASGAYQVIDSTWNNFGGYARAVEAPPQVQDQFAYDSFVAILKAHGDNIAAIPLAWYYPKALANPDLLDTVPVPKAGNTLTIRDYQQRWVNKFHELLGGGAPVFLPADTDALIPAIAFPVLGPTRFVDDWHFERGGGARVHEGIDLMGVSGQPLRAAFDGEVSAIRWSNDGTAGVGFAITRADGVYANYFHVNDDTPGTIDGSAAPELRLVDGIELGTTVRAGQIVGFMGDSGNGAGNPHLHFELRTPDREPIAPFPAIIEAQQREQCSVGIGPWSTIFSTTISDVVPVPAEGSVTVEPDGGVQTEVPFEIVGPDDARWTISADGRVTASGFGALITPGQGACEPVADTDLAYGTNAAGMALNLLPADWLPIDDRNELDRIVDAFIAHAGGDASIGLDEPDLGEVGPVRFAARSRPV